MVRTKSAAAVGMIVVFAGLAFTHESGAPGSPTPANPPSQKTNERFSGKVFAIYSKDCTSSHFLEEVSFRNLCGRSFLVGKPLTLSENLPTRAAFVWVSFDNVGHIVEYKTLEDAKKDVETADRYYKPSNPGPTMDGGTKTGLAVKITASEFGVIGTPITFQIVVTNGSRDSIKNVQLTAMFDLGLEHETKSNPLILTKEGFESLAVLAPGESRVSPIVLTPRKAGRFTARISAIADGFRTGVAETVVTISEQMTSPTARRP